MGKYAKAIVGALLAGLAAYSAALSDGTVSRGEWVAVAVALVGALGAVWAVPNKQPQ